MLNKFTSNMEKDSFLQYSNLISALTSLSDRTFNDLNKIGTNEYGRVQKIYQYLENNKIFREIDLKLFKNRMNEIKRSNVSPCFDFKDLIIEYKYNIHMKNFVEDAIKKYNIKYRREIRGDGNCFYRSVMFGFLELIVAENLIKDFCNFIQLLIDNSTFTIYSLANIPIAKRIVCKIVAVLKSISEIPLDLKEKKIKHFLPLLFTG